MAGGPDLVVGESLVPLLTTIFQRIGIEEQVRALGVRKPGVTFAFDEGNDFQLSFDALRDVAPNYAYNVPRKEFDQLLLDTRARLPARRDVETRREARGRPRARTSVRLAPETLALDPAMGRRGARSSSSTPAGGAAFSPGCSASRRRPVRAPTFRISPTTKAARGPSRTGRW